jgi:SIR2-like domain
LLLTCSTGFDFKAWHSQLLYCQLLGRNLSDCQRQTSHRARLAEYRLRLSGMFYLSRPVAMLASAHLRNPFAVLAGAGISYAPPSSLPKAVDMETAVINGLPINGNWKSDLLQACSWTWDDGLGFYHFLRFEQMVEALQLTVDPNLSILRELLPASHPNRYHHFLAQLLKRGFPILTTNFDRLIEEACLKCGFEATVLATEEDYASYLATPNTFKNPLFKLHGTISAKADDRCDLAATITEVTHQIASPSKWRVTSELLEKHDLLVIGYSGSDDFDIMPQITYAKGSRRLCWVNHTADGVARTLRGVEGSDSVLRHRDQKLAWFFDRMFLSFDFQYGAISRQPKDTLVMDTDTARAVDEIAAAVGLKTSQEAPVVRKTHPDPAREVHRALTIAGPASFLLAGRLLQEIGRYDRATECLHSFLAGKHSPQQEARCHLWLAQMAHERAHRASAACHLKHAYRCSESAGPPLEWTDVVGFHDLNPYAGNAGYLFEILIATRWPAGKEKSLRGHMFRGWELGRRHISDVIYHLQRHDIDAATDALAYLKDGHIVLDDELRADEKYWGAILLSISHHGAEEREDVSELAMQAARVYERLQRRNKWIDALIFVAEQKLPVWADSAYEAAAEAAMVARFIGNSESEWHALERQATAADIYEERFGQQVPVEGFLPQSSEDLLRKALDARRVAEQMSNVSCCQADFRISA